MTHPIKRSREKEGILDSAVLNVEQGALLKCVDVKIWEAKFSAPKDNKDAPENEHLFRTPQAVCRMQVVDDRDEGDFDGEEFDDFFPLKLDTDLLDETGFDERRLEWKKQPKFSDFTAEERDMLLDMSNWTVRDGSKIGKYFVAAFGKNWHDKVRGLEAMEDSEVIAKVSPRTGNKQGSVCGWDTFISANPPKKQKKPKKASDAEQAELSKEDEKTMHEVLD